MSERLAVDWAGMFDAPGPCNEAAAHADGLAYATASTEPTESLRGYGTSDDRRWCADCQRLTERGRCTAPAAGLLIASRQYEPEQTRPRRCIAYLPGPNDPDQTPGAVRWQWLKDAE